MQTCEFSENNETSNQPIDNKPFSFTQSSDELCEFSEIEDDGKVSDWPVLNEKALHGFAGDFVELATTNSEADPAAVHATFMTRFSVECGAGPYFNVGDSRHSPRLFTAVVGASSKARKGTSAKPIESLFDLDEIIQAKCDPASDPWKTARTSPGPLSSGEGIIYAVRDPSEEWKVNPKTGDGKWVQTDPGVEDKRLYIHDEEFASALSCTKREGNTLSAILRNLWDSGTIEPLTKSNKIKSTGAHIGICTHITNAELNKKLDETEAFNGFANRFLWVAARRPKLVPLPTPMDPGKLFLLQERLIEIIKSARRIRRMQFSPNAEELWCRVYPKLSEAYPGLIGTVLGRGEAQVIRLSMLYALLDQSEIIRATHLEAALAFWEYSEASAKIIFVNRCEDPTAERILKALKDGPLSKSELFNVFQRRISKNRLNPALQELVSQGKIMQETIPTKGARKTLFRIAGKPA